MLDLVPDRDNDLTQSDHCLLQAVEGWLELGNPREAAAELEQVRPELARHPAVLDRRWQIQAAIKDWAAALETSWEMTRLAAEESQSWVHLAYTLHELGRTQEAWDNLLPKMRQWPELAIIPYNLGCYACRLGHPDDARSLLKQAFLLDPDYQPMALCDPDLVALRPWIEARMRHTPRPGKSPANPAEQGEKPE
jgi:tetratricopeptide (TPR) repeat protein